MARSSCSGEVYFLSFKSEQQNRCQEDSNTTHENDAVLSNSAIVHSIADIKISRNNIFVDGVEYVPTTVLAKEVGYDSDHIALLSRRGKIQSLKQDDKWYATRDSLVSYKQEADEKRRILALSAQAKMKTDFASQNCSLFSSLPNQF